MSIFDEVTSSYQSAGQASVYLINADPGPVASVAGAHTGLRKLVGDGDEDLADLAEILRHARYRLATNILPGSHGALGLAELVVELRSALAQLHHGTPAHIATVTGINAIDELLDLAVTSLAEEVFGVLETSNPESRAVVVPHSRNVEATDLYLRERNLPSTCLPKSALRKAGSFETVVLVGPHQFFPAATWNAARADCICFVQYPLGNPPIPSGGLFAEVGGLKTPEFRTSGATGTSGIAPMEANEGLVAAAARESQRRTPGDSADEILADLLLLEGGYAVWTAASDGSWTWSVDVSDDHDPTIVPLKARNIMPGHYVIFRDGGAGSDLVRAIADNQHGAGKYRRLQDEWKDAFRAEVHRVGGPNAAARQIREAGATTANVRHWISREAIRPNRRSDFAVACKFAGIESRIEQIWAALVEINRAHLRAGQTIRKLMEQSLISDGAMQLRSEGYQRLELAGFGTLSAYRVIHVHGNRQLIDADLIDQPFLAEERGWQG